MLRPRLIYGTLIIGLLSAFCWADAHAAREGIWLAPLALLLCGMATHEMLVMFRAAGRQPIVWATHLGTLLPVLGACAPLVWAAESARFTSGKLAWFAGGMAAGLMVAILAEVRRYRQPGQAIANLACAALSILYIGGLLGFVVQLRLVHSDPWGLAALVSMLGTVKLSDSAQYVFGNWIGKRKLAPELSPGKTWEGAIYGLAAAVVVASLVLWLVFGHLGIDQSLARVALYCLLVGFAGLSGDLAESMLKRDAGVKDSSRWLPGLGGVLDMLDSLLFAAPVAYFCWAGGLVGP